MYHGGHGGAVQEKLHKLGRLLIVESCVEYGGNGWMLEGFLNKKIK